MRTGGRRLGAKVVRPGWSLLWPGCLLGISSRETWRATRFNLCGALSCDERLPPGGPDLFPFSPARLRAA